MKYSLKKNGEGSGRDRRAETQHKRFREIQSRVKKHTETEERSMKFEIYTDAAGETRWRLKAKNGKVIADGGEGFHSAGNARRSIKTFKNNVANCRIVVLKPEEPTKKED